MLKEFRLKEIKNILEHDGEVEISALCRMFNVTEMTIRRDLDVLSKDTSIVRTHGGAYMVSTKEMREPPYTLRVQTNCQEKEKIARKALEFLENGQNVFLDSGTTTYYVAKNMPVDCRNMILTNGLNVACEVINRRKSSVLLVGGDLRQNSLSTSGALAEEMLKKFKVDIAFLGTNAIDEDGNVYVGTTSEVGLKSTVMKSCIKCYILADSSKFNIHNLIYYTNARDVEGIITDDRIDPEVVRKLESKKINVIVAA